MVDTLAERGTIAGADTSTIDVEAQPESSPPRRRIASVLLVLAILAGIGTLTLPWLDLSLVPSLRAFDLSPGLARLQFPGVLSYGAIVSVVLVVALTSIVRAGWRPTVTSGRCGWALIALTVVFGASTLIGDGHVQWLLQSDNDQLQIFYSQIPSTSVLSPPANYLGANLNPATTNLLNDLGSGLFCLMASGILLVMGAPLRRGRVRLLPAICVGVVTASSSSVSEPGGSPRTRRWPASRTKRSGSRSQPSPIWKTALRWDPSLQYDPALGLGTRTVGGGSRQDAVRWPRSHERTGSSAAYSLLVPSILLDEQAMQAAPNNPIIAESLADLLAHLSATQHRPQVVPTNLPESRYPALTYTLAHYFYDTGDYQTAERTMRQAITESPNKEFASYALTYIALSEQASGQDIAYRRDIVAAVKDDKQVANRPCSRHRLWAIPPQPPVTTFATTDFQPALEETFAPQVLATSGTGKERRRGPFPPSSSW